MWAYPFAMKTILAALLALGSAAFSAEKPSVLLVLTNHGELGNTGEKTGFYLSEAAHPYEVFTEAGHPVEIASPEGGFAPLDPKSLELDDAANKAFWEKFGNADSERPGIAETKALSEIDPAAHRAIFFAGGHGTMWDFPTSASVRAMTSAIYSRGGVAAAVCHGPAAFVNLKLPDGSVMVADKKVAVFTNAEEEAVGLTEEVPFLLQTAFEDMEAEVVTAPNFTENAVRDGRVVTGQNPASAKKAAELVIEALDEVGGYEPATVE